MEESCLWAREWRNSVSGLAKWGILFLGSKKSRQTGLKTIRLSRLRAQAGPVSGWTGPIESTSKNAPNRGRIKKHGVWDPMPELTITSPYVVSRVDSNTCTCTMGNPMPESTLTQCQSRLYPPSQGLRIWPQGMGNILRRESRWEFAAPVLKSSPFNFLTPLRKTPKNKETTITWILVYLRWNDSIYKLVYMTNQKYIRHIRQQKQWWNKFPKNYF